VVPGKGKLVITGLLEKGMEESGQAAMSYVRSRLDKLGLEKDFYSKVDVHVHFPDFVRKDGPSAGVTMVTALTSLLSGRPVRADVAMTGEVTLTGQVLPIGGLKEKALAAQRNGIRTVIAPEHNEQDIDEIPEHLRKTLHFVFVSTIDEVLDAALTVRPQRGYRVS
jgi:ATP-dependent Lon protease